MESAKNILVVEDETDLQELLRVRLENAGYAVFTAGNGQEGLEQVKKTLPDLIISDVLMPVMDGFSFYKELKRSRITSDIPVIILTARDKMEDTFQIIGVDAFIAKPFDSQELLKKVKDLLNRIKFEVKKGSAQKILVAGTDPEVVENMVVQLKKQGCTTEFVMSGPEVISRAVLFIPDILILEVEMYGMPAEEIIRVVRQMPQFRKMTVLTYAYYRISELGSASIREKALGVDAAQAKCLEAGATKYLGHFNENSFMRSVSKYLPEK